MYYNGIVKLTDFMEISLIAMPAKLLILGPGEDRFRLENEQIPVNLTVPVNAQIMWYELICWACWHVQGNKLTDKSNRDWSKEQFINWYELSLWDQDI